jgi:hypothetical protein
MRNESTSARQLILQPNNTLKVLRKSPSLMRNAIAYGFLSAKSFQVRERLRVFMSSSGDDKVFSILVKELFHVESYRIQPMTYLCAIPFILLIFLADPIQVLRLFSGCGMRLRDWGRLMP